MRILHCPIEIAQQVALTAAGQRDLGHVAHAYFPPHPFAYSLAPDRSPRSSNRWLRLVERVGFACVVPLQYDVVHFHFAQSLLPEVAGYLDARAYRRVGRRVVVEFWGSDVRLPDVEAARNPYYVNAYGEDGATNRRRLQRWSSVTGGHAVVPDHSFLAYVQPYFDKVHVVRQRVDTKQYRPTYPRPDTRSPVVVHAPSQREYKGTRHLEEAVSDLRRRGLRFEYREVHGLSHDEAIRVYEQADLVVDQLCSGSHGAFAVEAMSLGKPVISWILPELVPTYPEGFPVISANPATIADVLADWVGRPEDRHRLGRQAREYAERVHDTRVVARRLVDVYRSLP